MTEIKTAAIILCAGKGTRMCSELPKVLHKLAGRPMLSHLLDTLSKICLAQTTIVIGENMSAVADIAQPHPAVVQSRQLGTGHAVLAAREILADRDIDFFGDVIVFFGADPLIKADTITQLIKVRRTSPNPSIVVLGFEALDPGAYGRLILNKDGSLDKIVEANDATEEQLNISLCNSGVMLIDGKHLWSLLERIRAANTKGEYYLTDIVSLARDDGLKTSVVFGEEEELLGIDDRIDLACAEDQLQTQLRLAAMQGGATLINPESIFFSYDTKIGHDVNIGPNVVFGPGVTIGNNVTILSFCHIEGTNIADGARIGPFARLRPGAEIASDAHIGNFVEIKASTIETGAKINHLSYVGDTYVGSKANIGAGTITCNYNGKEKNRTHIGKEAFIGSNVSLVAPISIGDGAIIGAGSVITKDVSDESLALTRTEQKELPKRKQKLKSNKGKE
jgi:bifunctional UDP-N-acetylglucosamine pyrophosphorylase/glucosamine-1-phosphate N-acetyltransferase